MIAQQTIRLKTPGRSTSNITEAVQQVVEQSSIKTGLCHLFIKHTSASLIITENADFNVQKDLENFLAKLVPDGDPDYNHDQEGPDDMAAHIRSSLTQTELTIPVSQCRLVLGTWQGIFLWEHRIHEHRREIVVTLSGDNT